MIKLAGPPLRFGIMCGRRGLCKWQAATVRELIASGNGKPVLLIVDSTDRLADQGELGGVLWRLFSRFNRPRSTEPTDLLEDLRDVPELLCHVNDEGSAASFIDQDVASIRRYDLDFLLHFGFGDIRGDVLESARYGVWSFRLGDDERDQGTPPYFWEIYYGDPISGAVLLQLTGQRDKDIALRRGFIKTLDYSYSRNYDRLAMEAAHSPNYVASAIRAGAHTPLGPSPRGTPVQAHGPSDLAMLRFAWILARNIARRVVQRCMRDEWSIGVVPLSIEALARGAPIAQVRWFTNPSDGWVADPIVRSHDGRIDVLCERMELATGKGYIAALQFDGESWSTDTPAIRTGCHASYPYLIEAEGQIYCVPETGEASELRLYRAVAFPTSWEAAGVLLPSFPAVDSTIFQFEGRWWLFATSREACDHKLFAWYADGLRGPWQPHRANPIKIDERSARPAGPPFWINGALYRPAQDSSTTYGGRIALHRITELTPTRFCEQLERFIAPDPTSPYKRGLHTLSAAGASTVIDGKRWRLQWPGPYQEPLISR
jgi:hypothetical protein